MTTRRQFVGRGLGALALGLLGRRAMGRLGSFAAFGSAPNPFLALPRAPLSVSVEGLPFASWYTGVFAAKTLD